MDVSVESPEILIDRHEAFLNLTPVNRPLLGFWLGGYYPADQFPIGTAIWRDGQPLQPKDALFEPFASDYEALYRIHQQAEDDFFYVGSAYWGIPWMEAILGCPVAAAGANCRAESCLDNFDDVRRLATSVDGNPWLETLVQFTRDLVKAAAGRFPVCPPLLRGPGDCASALLGGMPFVMGFHDDPDQMRDLLDHCFRMRQAVIHTLNKVMPTWHGTYAAGGYPSKMWCRRPVAYNQEDCAALLSPDLFKQFLLPIEQQVCRSTEVNFVHLHSSCLYPVDILLENRCYDVLELNIDHPGGSSPTLAELLPTLARIQAARRPLLLWGELTLKEWRCLRNELSPIGLSLQPIVRQLGDLRLLQEVLR